MTTKGGKQNAHISERLDLLKQQQSKWIEQRSTALLEEKKKKNTDIQSPKKQTSTNLPRNGKTVDKKSDTLLWSSNSCSNDYTGFVVRKPNAKGGSRPGSAKSSSSRKNDHENKRITSQNKDKTSLKDKTSKTQSSASDDDINSFSEADVHSIKSEETTDMELPEYPTTPPGAFDLYLNHSYTDNAKTSDTFNHFNNMSTHCCPMCKELMIGQYAPYVVIPCGHSFCSLCLSGEVFCPLCRNNISSVEENLTMSKIISHFQVKKREEEKKKKEADAKKYVDEYQSLSTRTNAMKEEAAVIMENMENITNQILDKKKSIKSIVEEAGGIRKQIEGLREKLNQLEVTCSEENEAVNALDSEYDSCKKQLVLAEKTIKTLEQSQDRVKMIVEDLLPSLNLNS